jgi:hypothetical protein
VQKEGVAWVFVEWTVLKCRGPHPYASKLPGKFGDRMHDVQVGFPVPFRCRPTGRVWRREDPAIISTTKGRLLIHAQCACGAVTEYEVERHSA